MTKYGGHLTSRRFFGKRVKPSSKLSVLGLVGIRPQTKFLDGQEENDEARRLCVFSSVLSPLIFIPPPLLLISSRTTTTTTKVCFHGIPLSERVSRTARRAVVVLVRHENGGGVAGGVDSVC